MVFHYQSVQYLEHLGSLYCTTPNLEDCTTASTSTVEVVNDGRRDYLWFQSKDGRFHDKWHWLSLDKITANKETATQRHLLKISLCQDNIHNKRNHTKKNNNHHHTFVTFQFSSRSDLESAKIYLKQYRNEARLAVDDDPIIDKPKEKTKDTTGGTSPTATNSSAGATSVTWVDESRPGHSLASLVATAMARDPSPAHTASTVSPSQSLTPLTSTSFSTYAVGSSSSHPTAAPPSQPRHFFPNHASTPVIVPDDGDEEFEDETTNHDEVPVCTLQGKVDNKKSKQEYKNQPQYPNKCNNLANTNDLQRPDDMKNVTKCDTPPSSLTVQEECELQRLIHQALEERLQQLGMDKDGTNENTRRRQSSRSCCDQCLSNIYAYLHTPIMTIISWIPSVSLVDRFSLPTALCMALLILTCKIAFVILFTFFMTTAQCTPTRTMIPADAPSLLSSSSTPLLYSSIYSPSHNQYLCSTYSSPDGSGKDWEGCTLEGMTCRDDYNQHPQCQDYQPACGRGGALLPVAETEVGASTSSNSSVETATTGGEDLFCTGLVSATYITCPHAGIVLGSSLAYVTYLELILVGLLLSLAWIGKPCQKRQNNLPTVLEEDAQRRRDGRKSPHPQSGSKESC